MECLKNKALFLVEGADKEVKLVNKIAETFRMDICVVSVCANIYMLYKKLKEDDFNVDIVNVLLESPNVCPEDKKKLAEKNFAYTYLIFDFDIQHFDVSNPDKLRRGLVELQEMVDHFRDETDGTVGKIYINYPMLESYRDCKNFYEDSFRDKIVPLAHLKDYKQTVGNRGNNANLSKYTELNFRDLIRMHLSKANYVCRGAWKKPAYETYIDALTQPNLAESQANAITGRSIINVLNCSLFFVVDYFGNKEGFFENI